MGGGKVCVVGKVLVLQGPIPREIAEIIIAAGTLSLSLLP